tara:strand:- start:9760 stop:10188 length:429 start_codon:yes stop_codon:yes gene_type:complete
MRTIKDVKKIHFNAFTDSDVGWGTLVPLELSKNLPFEPKRIFYVYSVDNKNKRGLHSHYKTEQVLICLHGSCGVVCKDGESELSVLLDSPSTGLYIPEMIWDEQVYMSDDTVLLVIANTNYDTKDYINDYEEFLTLKADERN